MPTDHQVHQARSGPPSLLQHDPLMIPIATATPNSFADSSKDNPSSTASSMTSAANEPWPLNTTSSPSAANLAQSQADHLDADQNVEGVKQGWSDFLDQPGIVIPSYHGLPVPALGNDSVAADLLDHLVSKQDTNISSTAEHVAASSRSQQSGFALSQPESGLQAHSSSDFPFDTSTGSAGTHHQDGVYKTMFSSPFMNALSQGPQQQTAESTHQSGLRDLHPVQQWLLGPDFSQLDPNVSSLPDFASLPSLAEIDLASFGLLLQGDQELFQPQSGTAIGDEEAETQTAPETALQSSSKAANAAGCDECRTRSLSCDLETRLADTGKEGRPVIQESSLQCSNCDKQNLKCVRRAKPNANKKFGRPSRTGRRIEQARLMHGSVNSQGAAPDQAAMPNDAGQSRMSFPGLNSLQKSEQRLSASIISGAISLRLLTCFFATAHVQMPIVDFSSFRSRYNLAKGDPRLMSIMLNGGDTEEDIPSLTVFVPGLKADKWPETGESTISTPGTSETIIAVMQAWAAHYTDMPIAFGSKAEELGMTGGTQGSPRQAPADAAASLSPSETGGAQCEGDTATGSRTSATGGYDHLPPSKRPKRKQGVACDTCRLRRVRCDLMERKDGMACSRCQDKKIVCTDEYIQTKRRKSEAKSWKEKEKMRKSRTMSAGFSAAGSDAGSTSDFAGSSDGTTYHNSTYSMVDQLGENPDPLAWSDVPATPEILAGSAKFPSLVPLGQARAPFCHDLLTRAVVLIHKHQLLYRPSVEAVQALVLLVQLFYLVDPAFASEMTAAAASHMRALGLQSVDEIDETDQRAVANLFNLMQLKRVWCATWTGDAIATCVYRRTPNFEEEKPISIRGIPTESQPGTSDTKADGKKEAARAPSPMPGSAGTEQGSRPAPSSGSKSRVPPELTPEMGLSFSVMALMQIGVLARFVTKHIDGISGPTLRPAAERFPMLPSSNDSKKLAKACHAVWKSNDALISFFDRCTLKSWRQMEALKIFLPKSWIAACKVTSAVLMLSVYRILGERYRLNTDYLSAVSRAHGSHVISAEDLNQSRRLKELLEHSRLKALVSCRRVARLVEKLLQKPTLTFQTGGIFLRQIFAVAQFLARTPVEEDVVQDPTSVSSTSDIPPAGGAAPEANMNNNTSPPAPPTKAHVDPRSLSMHSTGTFIPVVQPERVHPTPSDLYDLALDFGAPLPVFSAQTRSREVHACLEALDQLGYAWPMREELQSISSILLGTGCGNRFGHALA